MPTGPPPATTAVSLEEFVPSSVGRLSDPQRDVPRIAKDPNLTRQIEEAVSRVPTRHVVRLGDARDMAVEPGGVHLVLTSPPYWTLKEYNPGNAQLGDIEDYDRFLDELDRVWRRCFDALAPGGRLVCVVGDVCLSRRQNGGRHTVVPLHASIQERCRRIGFDNLSPIVWHKISNAAFEAEGNGASFLGKPYEPNSVIKNDIEYILFMRKGGQYRSVSHTQKLLSMLTKAEMQAWFRSFWIDVKGASTRTGHPAPFPVELAERLIRMFSFAGDTVLDPFMGLGSTNVAAINAGRNSLGNELETTYYRMASQKVTRAARLPRSFGATRAIIK